MISKNRLINREDELELMEREWRKNSSLIIVYGRRRIGKTRLLQEFSHGKNTFFFTFPDAVKSVQMREFKQRLAEFFNDKWILKLETDNWFDVFSYISTKLKKKTCFILDEFTYAIKSNKKILSDLQRIWDHEFRGKEIMLIICGSLLGMVREEVLAYTSPLYGRRSRELFVTELNFLDAAKFFDDFEYGVQSFMLVGGVPEYLLVAKGYKHINDFILEEFMNTKGYFYREPYYILSQELRELKTYFSIINAIAFGKTRPEEIANFIGAESRGIYPYLENLIRLGFVERLVPIIGKRKRGIYVLKDSMLDTWFNFVYPNRELIELGKKATLEPNVLSFFYGRKFEGIAKQSLLRLDSLKRFPFSITKLGKWWYREREIDLVALNEQTKQIAFFEVKWDNFQSEKEAKRVLEKLKEKSGYVQWLNAERKEYFGLIAKKVNMEAKKKLKGEGYVVFDLKDAYTASLRSLIV